MPLPTVEEILTWEPERAEEYLSLAEELKEIERVEKAQSNLKDCIKYLNAQYIPADFHSYMCERLTKFVHGEIKRLIFILPPGRGKSFHTSIYAPSYALGCNPDHKIIATSYGADLASSFNRQVQKVMLSEEYKRLFPESALGQKNIRAIENQPLRNSDIFELQNFDGYYKSAGVGGAITGRRFSLGFIDDYVKGFEEANSPVYRDKIWNWFRTDFMSRQLPNAGICITATRWHEEDLIGMVLRLAESDPNADQWEVIHYPEIVETHEDIHSYDKREIGELLWESRYDMTAYKATRAAYDTYQFNALYQGRPTAREGNVFKREWYLDSYGKPFTEFPTNGIVKQIGAYWDLAYSENPNADETSGSLMMSTKQNEEYVIDLVAFRALPAQRNQKILETCLNWNILFPNVKVGIEGGIGAGVTDAQELVKLLIMNGINAYTDSVRSSKVDRATSQQGSFLAASQNKVVKFTNKYSNVWIEPTLLQLSRLTMKETSSGFEFTGDHDDRLDCLVGNHNKLTKLIQEFNITIINDIQDEWEE